jgi:hypothetical protein
MTPNRRHGRYPKNGEKLKFVRIMEGSTQITSNWHAYGLCGYSVYNHRSLDPSSLSYKKIYFGRRWIKMKCKPVHVKWVHCHHCMARPRVEDRGDGLQICSVAANILNKQSRTADSGWYSSLVVGRGAKNPTVKKPRFVTKHYA